MINYISNRTDTDTVKNILPMIDEGKINIDLPKYDDRPVWDITKQSRLIESIFLNIELPYVHLVCRYKDNLIYKKDVIDGKEIIRAIHEFVNNKYKLNLPNQPELHDKTFDDLSNPHKNRILDGEFRLISILNDYNEEVVNDIIGRLN